MARPIKETPTLYGKDAQRLMYGMSHPVPVSAAEVKAAKKLYDGIMANTKFKF